MGSATGVAKANQPSGSGISAGDARAIAKEAYIYGFPMVMNYQTMYKQAIDKNSPDFRGDFNSLNSAKSVATPDDKFVVTPNSDTPYSYVWMDLRAEPVVITMPKIETESLLHRAARRSLHLQLCLSWHSRLRQRRRQVHYCGSRLEWPNTSGRQRRLFTPKLSSLTACSVPSYSTWRTLPT